MAVWRRWHPSTFRTGSWYLLGAVSLTLLWLAAAGLAPHAGLTRSYWYPDDASTEPVTDERVTAIDLAFIDEQDQPTRNYRVRWQGVWFSARAERVDFYAGADDGVAVRLDGETVLERNPAVGMHTVAHTVELEAGAHRLEIEHWQDGGGRSLNLQWAPAGDAPAAYLRTPFPGSEPTVVSLLRCALPLLGGRTRHRPGVLELSPDGIRACGRSCSATPRGPNRIVGLSG